MLGNLQVLVVGVVAWWLLGERPHAGLGASVPVLMLSVTLVSGALGGETYGRDPRLGVLLGLATSVAHAGFILVLRQGSKDLRRLDGPLLWATASAGATGVGLATALGELERPSWTALGWLLAQPVGSMAIGGLLLSEASTAVQYAGTARILGGVALATAPRPRAVVVPATPAKVPVPA